jgi:hypothetical protein
MILDEAFVSSSGSTIGLAFSGGGADENHPDHRGFRIGVAIMAAIRSRGASFGRGVSGRGSSTSIVNVREPRTDRLFVILDDFDETHITKDFGVSA